MANTPPQVEKPVSRDELAAVVVRFYEVAREDPLIGPVFMERVGNWDAHLEKMTRFWASALLREGSYQGNPIQKHRSMGLTHDQFVSWLELFEQTAIEVLGQGRSAELVGLAQRMGQSIEMRSGVRSKYP